MCGPFIGFRSFQGGLGVCRRWCIGSITANDQRSLGQGGDPQIGTSRRDEVGIRRGDCTWRIRRWGRTVGLFRHESDRKASSGIVFGMYESWMLHRSALEHEPSKVSVLEGLTSTRFLEYSFSSCSVRLDDARLAISSSNVPSVTNISILVSRVWPMRCIRYISQPKSPGQKLSFQGGAYFDGLSLSIKTPHG